MYDFGIIGGDIRQMYIAEYLADAGYSVFCYGVENMDKNNAKNMEEVFEKSEMVIAPVPYSKDGKNLFLRNSYKRIENWQFASMIPEKKIVFSGAVGKDILRIIREKKGVCHDLLCDDEVEKYNSIATAEGTLAEVIMSHPGFIYGSRCLIVGYGKCGKTIADRVAALGASVTVCARRVEIRIEAMTKGYKAIDFSQLSNNIEDFEYIFNTVPVMVLDEKVISNVRENAMIIDIASVPGGADRAAIEKYGVNYKHCLGLPGKYCPAALARIYVKQILDSINKI